MGKLTSGWGTVRTAMVNGQLSSSGPALYSGSEVPPSGDFLSGNADAQESPVHDPVSQTTAGVAPTLPNRAPFISSIFSVGQIRVTLALEGQ